MPPITTLTITKLLSMPIPAPSLTTPRSPGSKENMRNTTALASNTTSSASGVLSSLSLTGRL